MASASTNEFGWNLFSLLSTKDNKNGDQTNLLISPFSLSMALSMTRIGAMGETASGMEKALCWKGNDGDAIHEDFQQYIESLSQPDDMCTVKTANRIYIEEGFPILDSCSQQTSKYYMAEPVSAQFKKDGGGERTRINAWVEAQTEKKIKDLIPQDFIVPETKMVLVNAIYFKGLWKKKFDERYVEMEPFHVTSAKVKPVLTMKIKHRFPYHKAEDYGLVELPYKGDKYSMVILLPDEKDGLKDLEERLTMAEIQESISKKKLMQVNLSLPKFEICSSFDLNEPLIDLGMKHAFSERLADFSGVTGKRNLFLYKAVHKAYMKVDEKGTEAAAATAGGRVKQSARYDPYIPFRVDHPFLVLIRHMESGMFLFLGHINNPSETSIG